MKLAIVPEQGFTMESYLKTCIRVVSLMSEIKKMEQLKTYHVPTSSTALRARSLMHDQVKQQFDIPHQGFNLFSSFFGVSYKKNP